MTTKRTTTRDTKTHFIVPAPEKPIPKDWYSNPDDGISLSDAANNRLVRAAMVGFAGLAIAGGLIFIKSKNDDAHKKADEVEACIEKGSLVKGDIHVGVEPDSGRLMIPQNAYQNAGESVVEACIRGDG